MNTPSKKQITIIATIGVALLLIGGCSSTVGAYNKAMELRNTYDGKLKANAAEFDNMWKKIQQVSQVPEEKKNAFKEIISAYAGGRGPNGGTVLSAVREAVPNVDLNIYDQIVNIIVGSRNTWTTAQKELTSISVEHNNILTRFPSGVFLRMFCGLTKIDAQVITSTRTENAFQTGKDDDVMLFNRKAEK